MKGTFVGSILEASFVLLLVAVLLGMAGCAPPPLATEPPLVSTATQVPTTVVTETAVPTTTPTPFVPKATIKIVVHVPLSGDLSGFGTDMVHAAQLAVDQLAGPLNELGYKVDLVPYDDKATVATAITNAKEVVADPTVLCGVGHLNSAITIQASEIYHKAGLAFISPSSTNPAVTNRGYLEINRVIGRDDVQGVAGAQLAQAQGFRSAFVISNNSNYGRNIAVAFGREASQLGLKVLGTVATDQPDKFDSIIAKIIASKADLVYFAGSTAQTGEFFREARASNYSGAFLGPDSLDSPDLLDSAGPLLIDGGGTYYTTYSMFANGYPDAAQFLQDFQARYAAAPLMYAAQAYDAAGVCLKAIQDASQAEGGGLPTRKEVALAIRALKDYKGITGTCSFNNKGDLTSATYFAFKVVTVDPEQWGQNTQIASYNLAPPK